MLKWILAILALIMIVVVAAAFVLPHYYNSMLEPVAPGAEQDTVLVDIPSGANREIIAAILYDHGLIHNELAFRVYVQRLEPSRDFVAGRYQLSPAMGIEQIVDKIQSGNVYVETAWFTIPEGFSLQQTAARLEELGHVKSDKFLQLAASPPSALIKRFAFLEEIDSTDLDYILEGYLFPDTYEIYTHATEQDIITMMLSQTETVLKRNNGNNLEQIGYTLHEVLTMASIVERETRVDHERERVAGVFYNRLDIGQRLESCATIQYILGETKEFLTLEDLQIPSPYNTYQNEGLPPGPIAAPGEKSIKAALNPEEHDFFFFNYKYDNTGEHYFSRTLDEHNRNVQKAEENLD